MFGTVKKIHPHPPENQKDVIDIIDWEDSDSNDDGKRTGSWCHLFFISRELQPTTRWKPVRRCTAPSVRPEVRFQSFGTGPDSSLTAIPDPYPTMPPPGQEAADAYYVVDVGRDVGIFTDKCVVFTPNLIVLTFIPSVLSTRAVVGVPGGHQVKVKSWYDAATLYNSLWDQGLIIRVRP